MPLPNEAHALQTPGGPWRDGEEGGEAQLPGEPKALQQATYRWSLYALTGEGEGEGEREREREREREDKGREGRRQEEQCQY